MDKKRVLSKALHSVGSVPGVQKTTLGAATKLACRIIGKRYMSQAEIEQVESGAIDKKTAVKAFFRKHPKRFRSDREMVKKLLNEAPAYKDRTKEEKSRIAYEMLFFDIAYGFLPEEYVCFELEGRTAEDIRSFVSNKERCFAVYQMNSIYDMDLFNDKGKTFQMFGSYFKRDAVYISKRDSRTAFLDFIGKHPVFVRKNVYESLGRSVELVDSRTCGKTADELFAEYLKEGPVILEERVVQSDIMAALNASSVNTIRCITIRTKNGVEEPFFFMKIGRAGSFVDNGGAGGIRVGIAGDTGILCTDGYDETNNRYQTHPDSGITIKGYQLPDWNSLKELCREIASKVERIRYIGWDLAHTNNGWVIIEGNCRSQMIGPQTVFKRGIRTEIESLMKQMSLF